MTYLDQEGNVLDIKEAKVKSNQEWLDDKTGDFIKALKKRCVKDNEVFNDLGYDSRAGANLYQVGLMVHGIFVTDEGLSPSVVGRIN